MGCLDLKYQGPATIEAPQKRESDLEQTDPGWIVTVYNNDYNTYDEVTHILMLATGCTRDEATLEAWEIDHLGRSVVHHGKEDDCQRAAEIIAKIGIKVEVSRE